MKVLVCGGAGYIGSHMCKMLVSLGHQITIFDNLSTGHRAAVNWGDLVVGDLQNAHEIDRVVASGTFDAVMHFSAKSLVGESVQRPDLYFSNNVVGTLNLLNSMIRHDVRTFIFSSTAAVYGNPKTIPIDEQHPTQPINPYGTTKRMAEEILANYDSAFGLRSVCLRYFNAAGADPDGKIGENHDPETHLIPNVLLSVLGPGQNPLKVFGNDYDTPDGTCVRDYIHVNDLCDAHVRAMEYLEQGGASDVFNLGIGRGFSVAEVIQTARDVTGIDVPYTVVQRRPGDPPVLIASSDKARRVLSWTPRYTRLTEIVETAWAWHSRARS